MKLDGKAAIITGSSQGVGSGIALKFTEEGADVVVNYCKNNEMAETVAEMIQQLDTAPSCDGAMPFPDAAFWWKAAGFSK